MKHYTGTHGARIDWQEQSYVPGLEVKFLDKPSVMITKVRVTVTPDGKAVLILMNEMGSSQLMISLPHQSQD